jgi:hypothetical protein
LPATPSTITWSALLASLDLLSEKSSPGWKVKTLPAGGSWYRNYKILTTLISFEKNGSKRRRV